MKGYFESLLQKSNDCETYVEQEILKLDPAVLNWKLNKKKWSVLEVLSHLNQVYGIYFPHFKNALKGVPQLDEGQDYPLRTSWLGQLSIYSMRPKGKKRRFKMKTFNFFEPTASPETCSETIELFLANKQQFNRLIKECRSLNLQKVKVTTSLGEKVRFYVPECLEFLVAHEERHMVQIEEILAAQANSSF